MKASSINGCVGLLTLWVAFASAGDGRVRGATGGSAAVKTADGRDRPLEFTEVHMGMPVRIVVYAAEAAGRQAAAAAFARIADLDSKLSDYRIDSELRRLHDRHLEWVPVSHELFIVVKHAVHVARATDGAFDPSVGPLVALWREAHRTAQRPDSAQLNRARSRVGWRHIDVDGLRPAIRLAVAGMQLDLGGIAKGYILQDAVRVMRGFGVSRVLVEAGGDIVVGDAPPGRRGWSIAAPAAGKAFQRHAAALVNAALATSGPSAQSVAIDGVRYSHVVDPRTGLGVANRYVARVIAADALLADALATAFTVAGPRQAGSWRRALGVRFLHDLENEP